MGLAKKQKLDASAGASSAAANGGEAAAADAAADVQPAAGGDVEMADTAAEGGSGSGAAVEYGGQLTGGRKSKGIKRLCCCCWLHRGLPQAALGCSSGHDCETPQPGCVFGQS